MRRHRHFSIAQDANDARMHLMCTCRMKIICVHRDVGRLSEKRTHKLVGINKQIRVYIYTLVVFLFHVLTFTLS